MSDKNTSPPERRGSMNATFELEKARNEVRRSFTPMVKVAGPVCNLECTYCYYLDKDSLYPGKKFALSSFMMDGEVLERFIRDYIACQPQQNVEFIWHGGEPTMVGLDYFRRIVELQSRYADGKQISNVLQTNGTLIDDNWAEFLAENRFLCGLSVDGSQKIHDLHRRNAAHEGSWDKAANCARLMLKHGVEFNTMTVVSASNAREPVATYKALCELGSRHMQFSPVIERVVIDREGTLSVVDTDCTGRAQEMEQNVSARDWGNFLCRLFDHWVTRDVGYRYVNWFDNTLAAYTNGQPSLCSMAEYCCCAPAIEHNGDVYACDHFVFPHYRLGNLMESRLSEMVKNDTQLLFEEHKKISLSGVCRQCEFLSACGGDCPKNRIALTSEGEKISALCQGFRAFFCHTRSHFQFMARELENNRPPANVMRHKF